MLAWDLFENSPDTPAGSRTKDLNLGKLWLLTELNRLGLNKFDNVYVLGSWYGSFGPYLLYKQIKFNQAYMIDIDPKNTQWVSKFNQRLAIENKIQAVTKDCNEVNFKGNRPLIINTSTNDIAERHWFVNAPVNTIFALQGRDNQPNNKDNLHQDLNTFDKAYPMSNTMLLDQIKLNGADNNSYIRFMKIGNNK